MRISDWSSDVCSSDLSRKAFVEEVAVGVDLIEVVQDARIEDEVGLGEAVDEGEVEAFTHAQVARRAQVIAARSQRAVPGIGPGLQVLPGVLAGGQQVIGQIFRNAALGVALGAIGRASRRGRVGKYV